MKLMYHNESFRETAFNHEEPEETLDELIKEHDEAIASYKELREKQKAAKAPYIKTVINEKGEEKRYVDYDEWDEKDPVGCMQWGMADFNGFNGIDLLEEEIDRKICYMEREVDEKCRRHDEMVAKFKEEDEKGSVQVYSNITSRPIYELTIYSRDEKAEVDTDEDYREMLNDCGYMKWQYYKKSVGFYPTFERAMEAVEMAQDSAYDSYKMISFVFIRQLAACMQMEPYSYLKEWSRGPELDECETLVRNYGTDEKHFCFHGRPKDMTNHKVGDIVLVVSNDDVIWGIVYAVPPTPEEVEAINNRAMENHPETLDGTHDRILDYTDDSYTILTSDDEYMASHEHVAAQYVFKPDTHDIPPFVEKVLRKGLTSTRLSTSERAQNGE